MEQRTMHLCEDLRQRTMNYSRVMIGLVVVVGTVFVLIEWSGFAVTNDVVIPYVQSMVGLDFQLRKDQTEKKKSSHRWTCESNRSSSVVKNREVLLETVLDTLNYTKVAFEDTTSPNFTVVTVEDQKVSYQPCDLLKVKIEARDWRNKTKNYGGDFFRLKIFSKDPSYSAAGEDEIIDFNNGTYLVYFTLRWSGKIMIQVKLIHPVEVLPQMKLTSSGKIGLNVTFVGEFISKNISEEVICRYAEIEPPFCNFSNPRTHGPWYCKKPKDPRLSCQDWKFHKMYKGTFLKLEENLSSLSRSLLKRSHMVEIRNKLSVTVEGDTGHQGVPLDMPYCSMNGVPKGLGTSGHFFQNRWYPNDCRVIDYSIDGGMKCLAGKNIVILGDSTIRQLFEYFRDVYKKDLTLLPLPYHGYKGHGPLELRSDKFNTSVKYHFHGLPMSGTGLVLRTDNIEFIVDRINSGKDGCEVIYVLSLWAHFIATGKEFYRQRLLAIKSAVQSFLDRCPRSKVIIKGANTKDHPAVWISIVSSEWNIVQHELELRKIFENERRVGFIDAFDVTKVQPYKDHVHPDRKIVKEFVNRLLTYICKVNVKR